MHKESGLVSVIIPTFNRYDVTVNAVESVKIQSYSNYEIIICDDNSTDGSYEKLSDHYADDDRIRIVKREGTTKGGNAARATAVKYAGGEFIAFLDSDDAFTEESLERRVNWLENHPECMLVYGDSNLPDGTINHYDPLQDEVHQERYLYEELSLCGYDVIMIRKKCIDDGLKIDITLRSWQDDDLVLNVFSQYGNKPGTIQHCGDIVLTVCGTGTEKITANPYNLLKGMKAVIKKHKAEIVKYCGIKRLLIWNLRKKYSWCYAYVLTHKRNPVTRGIGFVGNILKRMIGRHFRHIWG